MLLYILFFFKIHTLELELTDSFCVEKVVEHFEKLNVVYTSWPKSDNLFEFSVESQDSKMLTNVR